MDNQDYKDDFTFAMLAKAIASAGGRVHLTALDLLRYNHAYMVRIDSDGKGGVLLTLEERPR